MASNPCSPTLVPPSGYVETTSDALRLINAARNGIIPRIRRRLNHEERKTMIKSGAIFIFCVEESGIRRWTDELHWYPSDTIENFTIYQEKNECVDWWSPTIGHSMNKQWTLKPNGLIKKMFKVAVTNGSKHEHFHLISYYTSEEIQAGKLTQLSTYPNITTLDLPLHIFKLQLLRVPPKVETGPDGRLHFALEDKGVAGSKAEEYTYCTPDYSLTSPMDSPVRVNHMESSPIPSGLVCSNGSGWSTFEWSAQRQDTPWPPLFPTSLNSLQDGVTPQNSWSPNPTHPSGPHSPRFNPWYEASIPDLNLTGRDGVGTHNPQTHADATAASELGGMPQYSMHIGYARLHQMPDHE